MGLISISHVPSSMVQSFIDMGAVRAGIIMISKGRDYWTHEVQRVPFNEIVYFFDADGLEIGYWSVLTEYNNDQPMLFSPRRVWGQQLLNCCGFRTLVN